MVPGHVGLLNVQLVVLTYFALQPFICSFVNGPGYCKFKLGMIFKGTVVHSAEADSVKTSVTSH